MIRRVKAKPKRDKSPVSVLEEIFPGDTNAYGTAFGGKILALMDRAAGLAASRYAHQHFVTASLDAMEFRAPVRQGQIAEIVAQVVYTSARSCAVKVLVYAAEKTDWRRKFCGRGVFFMVSVDPEGKILTVPALHPRSRQEKEDWQLAHQAHQSMLQRRKAAKDPLARN